MFKVSIKRLNGEERGWQEFKTLELAQTWVDERVNKNTWGKPDQYTIEIIDLTEQYAKIKATEDAYQYLADTDYMVVRVAEGYPLPEEVKIKREESRNIIRK
jgi:hypothetical protein